jgi:putative ABC transport system ATP-binding protein
MSSMTQGSVQIRLQHVTKTYLRGKQTIEVLDGISLEVQQGAFEAFVGPSGSGKTTLLNLIAGLDRPSSGSVYALGAELSSLSESRRTRWRAENVGLIFQNYNLLPVLSALDNVQLPLLLTGLSRGERKRRATTALEVVGLADRMQHRPDELSGGQQQRVAIARAIVADPQIIVADEPTGDLDRSSADEILDLLEQLNREFKRTILMVTHDPAASARASATRRLDKGKLE